MDIRALQPTDLKPLYDFWHQQINLQKLLYKPMDENTFQSKFYNNDLEKRIVTYLALRDDHIIGCISGVIYPERNKTYLSMILVSQNHQHQSIASTLLNVFEQNVKDAPKAPKTIDIVFFNPIQFEWLIPNTPSHDHPNTPGVDIESDAFHFFQKRGYVQFAKQNSYYRSIEHYVYTDELQEDISLLKQKNIETTLYQQGVHNGFDELFEDLNNPHWRTEILSAVSNDQPVVIAHHQGRIIGFTGPLRVQHSLRGYFAGIGVHSEYRGYGIGKVLFSTLCLELSRLGATYMSLFTGETNPARKIYEKEHFEIVRSWANLRKEL